MSISNLIETIGLSASDLKAYVLSEIDEFLEADDPAAREEEFGDIIFALLSMAWAHSGSHYTLRREAIEPKVKKRLRTYAALTRYPPRYEHDRIQDFRIGVLHFAFGHFGGQWHQFEPLKNGTVAEIHLLTDAPFDRPETLTNHCIVTFDDIEAIQYDIIYASSDPRVGNTIRCRVPDFMFARAKTELQFSEFGEYLALQILAAIDGLSFESGAIAHFHSWETGFLVDSEEFRSRIDAFKTIFSPYLTTGRLKSMVDLNGGGDWTMSRDELDVAASYERKLCGACMRVVVESARDREFYGNWVHPDRLDVRSFALERTAHFPTDPAASNKLTFVAGGRPVREKGFVELCRQFASVRDWAQTNGIEAELAILCREPDRPDKGAAYIAEIEGAVVEHGLDGLVTLEDKISLERLRQRIAGSSAVIVPSLYDPFCLMPTYAVEARRPAFVSAHAGVSENIKSREFTFDPNVEGELAERIAAWYEARPAFEFESCFPSYRDLYLAREAPQPWA